MYVRILILQGTATTSCYNKFCVIDRTFSSNLPLENYCLGDCDVVFVVTDREVVLLQSASSTVLSNSHKIIEICLHFPHIKVALIYSPSCNNNLESTN